MGKLAAIFDRGTGGNCTKWRHYFEIYERYMARFVGQTSTYLEIGVERGGSLAIMQEYFGPGCRIVGIDINPDCAQLRAQGREIFIGDQADFAFLAQVARQAGPFDMIVDDGGHTSDQQLVSFFALFTHLADGGVYIVEDTHTTFWQEYQESRYGINFYDFAKGLVEKLTLLHMDPRNFTRFHQPPSARQGNIHINNFAVSDVFAVHFYDSMIVIEKRRRTEPFSERK